MKTSMGFLLDPIDSILLAVASPDAGTANNGRPDASRIDRILRAATASSVPVLEAQFAESSNASGRVPLLLPHEKSTPHPRRRSSRLVVNDPRPPVANFNRTSLIVAGYWLEEAITFLALRALAHSYRVYVVLDAIAAEDADMADTARQRLVFSGAVPTTSHQIVREWAATTSDPTCRRALWALRAA
jgi:hypothetical protein